MNTPDLHLWPPTGFVETMAGQLVEAGNDPGRIRTERFRTERHLR
jgi:hypothetical protein